MAHNNIDIILENQSLKSDFTALGLDLFQVFDEIPDDLERENRILKSLLDWVQAYRICPNRKAMEDKGYDFPPISRDLDPDSDWFRFERWMQNKPVRHKLQDILPIDFFLIKPEDLTDDEIEQKLKALSDILFEANFSIEYREDIPPRLQYEHLLEIMKDEFEMIDAGWWHLDGCSGCCPDCFQRPWCEHGNHSCWPEDEKAGQMVIIDTIKQYLCASSVSLKILKQRQEKEDKEFEKFEKNHGDDPIIDIDKLDDLPF